MYGQIYGLFDPRTGALRYVGQTTKSLTWRLRSHLRCNRRGRHVVHWIHELRASGLVPIVRSLAEASNRGELDDIEVRLIREARERGENLTNAASGGRVNVGWRQSDHARESVRLRSTGNTWRLGQKASDESRQRMRESHLGKPSPRKGMRHRPESLVKMSESLRGKPSPMKGRTHTPEARSLMGVANVGNRYHYRLDITVDQVRSMFADGMSKVAIATALGCSTPLVRKRLSGR